MLARRAQVTASVLTAVKLIHRYVHCILELSSLVLVEVDRCDSLVPSCIAFTAEGPCTRLASGKLSDGNVSTATHYTVSGLILPCQAYSKIIEAACPTRGIHVSRTDACLANRGDRVTQVLVAEQNVLILVSEVSIAIQLIFLLLDKAICDGFHA